MENIRNTKQMKKLLNDLYDYPNMKIYQYDRAFKFSLDSILLAEMVQFHKNDQTMLDLCTGNAAVLLVASTKSSISMYGVEIQKDIYDLGVESVSINHKDKQITLIHDSIANVDKYFPGNNFDIVTCNPPYFKYHHDAFLNDDPMKQMARHEISTNLKEVIEKASQMIKNKGNFYLVHISERFQEIACLMEQYQFSIKDVYFVYPKRGEKSFLVLVRATKRGKMGMKVHEPIFLSDFKTYQNLFEVIQ